MIAPKNRKSLKSIAVIIGFTFMITTARLQAEGQKNEEPAKPQLLRVGQFHGNEVSAASGEKWLALVAEKEGFRLVETTLKVELVQDLIADGENQKTGKKVSTNLGTEPIILIKNIKVKAGTVKAFFHGSIPLFHPDNMVTISTGPQRDFNLVVSAKRNNPDCGALDDYVLMMIVDKKTQELARAKLIVEDGFPSLLWAGDIDRDGKADLFFNLTTDDRSTTYALFLSSFAKEGELLGLVAEFTTVGC